MGDRWQFVTDLRQRNLRGVCELEKDIGLIFSWGRLWTSSGNTEASTDSHRRKKLSDHGPFHESDGTVALKGIPHEDESKWRRGGPRPSSTLRHLPAINLHNRWQNDAGLPAFDRGFDLAQGDSRCTNRRSRW